MKQNVLNIRPSPILQQELSPTEAQFRKVAPASTEALTSAENGLPAMCCPWKVTDTEYTPAAVAEKAPPYSPVPVSSICARNTAMFGYVGGPLSISGIHDLKDKK